MNTVGADNESGKMSPAKMLTTTLGDEFDVFNESIKSYIY